MTRSKELNLVSDEMMSDEPSDEMMSDEPSDVWPEVFQDPDRVGQSEYRAIYDLVKDCLESMSDEEKAGRKEHIVLVLNEVESWARSLQVQLAESQAADGGGASD